MLSSYTLTTEEDSMESAAEKNATLALRRFKAEKGECDGRPYRLNIPLRPYESVIIAF